MYFQINAFLIITSLSFFTGLMGLVFNRQNILITIMSIELMLLSVNLNLIMFAICLDDVVGQIFAVFVLTIAAAESAVGFALITCLHESSGNIQLNPVRTPKE